MQHDIADLRPTIVPKSDQLNSEQLLSGPITVKVSAVKIGSTDEQPISVHYENDAGRPFKPCKTMRKVLIFAWGADARAWPGRSMTLFCDPAVKFGAEQVGGIRISHLSDIDRDLQVSLTATKGKKALHVIKRLSAAPARATRSEKHQSIVADFELLARESGFEAFRESWERLPVEDRTAIGKAERDRIGAIGQATDTTKGITT